ncbi:MAG: hypothetical protein FJ044_01545 [Candidatus Cloacimonetes bacterium]|nr:hypothetical protein [Candidatus Cloacimonadota bacterium]
MPEETFKTPQTAEPTVEPKSKNWPKIILATIFSFALLIGAAYAGYWFGTESAKVKSQISKPTPTPTPEASPSPIVDETANWKTYTDPVHSFSLKYPPLWQITKGNEHAPSIPSNMAEITKLQSGVGTIDVSIIPWHNNLKKDLREELSSFISRYFGETDVSYESTKLGGETALQGSYLQVAFGSQTKVILTAIEKGDYVLFFQTQFDTEDPSRLAVYNQILSTFKFLD